MKEIPLTQGLFAQVDDKNYDWLMCYKWCAHKEGRVIYALGNIWDKELKKCKQIRMHRLIMNTPKNLEVDHIDHNGLNNQEHNMRNCSRRENGANSRCMSDNLIGYKGVSKTLKGKNKGCIKAFININGKQQHLGYFKNPIDAARAYNKAAKKEFGEYAYLNEVD